MSDSATLIYRNGELLVLRYTEGKTSTNYYTYCICRVKKSQYAGSKHCRVRGLLQLVKWMITMTIGCFLEIQFNWMKL